MNPTSTGSPAGPVVTGTAEAWGVLVDEVRAVLGGGPWEFVGRTGHGARARLVRTGTGAVDRDDAARELPAAATALVARLGP